MLNYHAHSAELEGGVGGGGAPNKARMWMTISRSQDWAQVGNGANFIYKVDSRVTFPAETDSERR